MTETLDMDAHYTTAYWPGIALYLRGYFMVRDVDYEWSGIEEADTSQVRAVMVGDDREHIIGVEDLILLDDNDYCAECGQVGCQHDGRDRS